MTEVDVFLDILLTNQRQSSHPMQRFPFEIIKIFYLRVCVVITAEIEFLLCF